MDAVDENADPILRPARRTMLRAGAALAGLVAPKQGLQQVAIWRREPDGRTLERAELRLGPTGLTLRGRVVGTDDGQPLEVGYEIACGPDGSTDRLTLVQAAGAQVRALELTRGPEGWLRDGRPQPDLARCLDVDLGVSPSTNLLPIRRTGVDTFELTAAWVRFPSLEVQPSRQSYERRAERLWRYRNLDSGFTAEIDVDRFALPIHYRGVWRRIAALES